MYGQIITMISVNSFVFVWLLKDYLREMGVPVYRVHMCVCVFVLTFTSSFVFLFLNGIWSVHSSYICGIVHFIKYIRSWYPWYRIIVHYIVYLWKLMSFYNTILVYVPRWSRICRIFSTLANFNCKILHS